MWDLLKAWLCVLFGLISASRRWQLLDMKSWIRCQISSSAHSISHQDSNHWLLSISIESNAGNRSQKIAEFRPSEIRGDQIPWYVNSAKQRSLIWILFQTRRYFEFWDLLPNSYYYLQVHAVSIFGRKRLKSGKIWLSLNTTDLSIDSWDDHHITLPKPKF